MAQPPRGAEGGARGAAAQSGRGAAPAAQSELGQLRDIFPEVPPPVLQAVLQETQSAEAAAAVLLSWQEASLEGTRHGRSRQPAGPSAVWEVLRHLQAASAALVQPPLVQPAVRGEDFVFEDTAELDELEVFSCQSLSGDWFLPRRHEAQGGPSVIQGGDYDSGSDTCDEESAGGDRRERARRIVSRRHVDCWIDPQFEEPSPAEAGAAARTAPAAAAAAALCAAAAELGAGPPPPEPAADESGIPPTRWWCDWEGDSSDGDLDRGERLLLPYRGVFAGKSRQMDLRQQLLRNRAVFKREQAAVLRTATEVATAQVVPAVIPPPKITSKEGGENGAVLLWERNGRNQEEGSLDLSCCASVRYRVTGPLYLKRLDFRGPNSWELGHPDERLCIDALAAGTAPKGHPGMVGQVRRLEAAAAPVQWQCQLLKCCGLGCCLCTCGDGGTCDLAGGGGAKARFDVGLSPHGAQAYFHQADVRLSGLTVRAERTDGCCAWDAKSSRWQSMQPGGGSHGDPGGLVRFLRVRDYRLRCGGSASDPVPSREAASLGGVQFFSAEEQKPPGVRIAAADNPGGDNPEDSSAELLFRPAPAGEKLWWSDAACAQLHFELASPHELTGYRFQTSGMDPGGDIVSWTLEGAMNPRGPWRVLHKHDGVGAVPRGRCQWTARFPVPADSSWSCARLRCAAPRCLYNCSFLTCSCCIRCALERLARSSILESFPPPRPQSPSKEPPKQHMQ